MAFFATFDKYAVSLFQRSARLRNLCSMACRLFRSSFSWAKLSAGLLIVSPCSKMERIPAPISWFSFFFDPFFPWRSYPLGCSLCHHAVESQRFRHRFYGFCVDEGTLAEP